MMKVYGCKGCGSAAIEALLLLVGEPFEPVRWEWDDAAGWSALERVNPLRGVPTVVTTSGQVLTESVAIILWLLERHPQADLKPEVGDPALADFFRWLIFLTVNVYGPIGIKDFPERWITPESSYAALQDGCRTRVKLNWAIMEDAVEPAPFLLGSTMTALDVYVAMMTRWTPTRPWFEENCPKIMGAVRVTESDPVVARCWRDNFATA